MGEKVETVTDFIFLGSKITVDGGCCHEIKRCLLLGRKAIDKPRQNIKKQRHHFADKSPYSYGFFSSHVRMWELNHKEGWAPKNWRFQIVVVEKISESLLDSTENKPVSPKGNQLWILNGRTDAEAETPIFWPPDTKSQLTGKDPDARKDWKQKKTATVRWQNQSNGHELEQILGDGEGQGSLACGSPRGHIESDTTWRMNNNMAFLFVM